MKDMKIVWLVAVAMVLAIVAGIFGCKDNKSNSEHATTPSAENYAEDQSDYQEESDMDYKENTEDMEYMEPDNGN